MPRLSAPVSYCCRGKPTWRWRFRAWASGRALLHRPGDGDGDTPTPERSKPRDKRSKQASRAQAGCAGGQGQGWPSGALPGNAYFPSCLAALGQPAYPVVQAQEPQQDPFTPHLGGGLWEDAGGEGDANEGAAACWNHLQWREKC